MQSLISTPSLATLIRLATRAVMCAWLLFLASSCAPTVSFKQLQPGLVPFDKDAVLALGSVNISKELNVFQGVVGWLIDMAVEGVLEDSKAEMEENMAAEVARGSFASYSRDGAGYFLNLSGHFSAQDTEKATTRSLQVNKDKWETVPAVQVNRDYRLELSYQVVTPQGTVVGEGRHVSSGFGFNVAANREEAAAGCDHWVPKKNAMTRKAVAEIVKKILPRYVTVKRTIKKGSALVNEGVAHAVKGNLEWAGQLWAILERQADSLSVGDRIALYNNLGVYYEFKDFLLEAAEAFSKCIELSGGDEVCTEGMNAVGTRQWQLDQLKKSGLSDAQNQPVVSPVSQGRPVILGE